ncbi:MAG: hypothetical protein KZQ56_07770 [gamma proteobacterium symbiont of Lucinoma myriamae]|nr:hypothetical protein [gamma proteobacterium symbiont of Lucinoma myriamae]
MAEKNGIMHGMATGQSRFIMIEVRVDRQRGFSNLRNEALQDELEEKGL